MELPKLRININWKSILIILSVIGPGIITSNVDNDPGGITIYSIAGANYGYALLWILIPVFVLLVVIQEMCARMGVVTGKGLADLIRENFGLRKTILLMLALLLVNIGNTVSEFAGVAAASEIFGVSRYIAVPLVAIAVWLLIVKGTFRSVEKVFLVASLFYVAYIISGFLAHPSWDSAVAGVVAPQFSMNSDLLLLLLAIIGTTIAPWMQFFLQSAVVEKGIGVKDYKYARLDVIIGSFAAVIVALFIIIACAATMNQQGIRITDAADAARALAPLAGVYASQLFAFGLLNAAIFSACILPLCTAYYFCEAMGWDSGVNKKFSEAPEFYVLYTLILGLGAALILIPGAPLIPIMIMSQFFNAILLPFVLIAMLMLANNREIMGEYVNGTVTNLIAIASTIVLIVMSAVMALSTLNVKVF